MRRAKTLIFISLLCASAYAFIGPFPPGGGGGGGGSTVTYPITIPQGGTGQTSQQTAIDALLPSQGGNSGKFLTTNGSASSWGTVSSTPGGSDTQVQYNNAGSLGGAVGITYANSTQSTTFTPTGSPSFGLKVDFSGITAITDALNISGSAGGAGTFRKGLYVNMVQPSSTGAAYGIRADITASGTTSGWTRAFFTENTATITSTTGDPINNLGGNTGFMSYVNTNTNTGAGYGFVHQGAGGNYQTGLFANINSGAGASAKSYGVRAYATNQTTTGTAEAVGGFFMINTTAVPTTTLGFSSALAADNGDTTGNILTLKDNGTSAFEVRDGGTTIIGVSGSGSIHVVNDNISVVSSMLLKGSIAGQVSLNAAPGTVSYYLAFPSLQGTPNTMPLNDGNGNLSWVSSARSVGISIDGGGSVISTGTKGYVEVPYNGLILGWTALADTTGSCVVDVWKDTFANYPPTVADTIAGSEKPTITSSNKGQDLSLTTWTTTVTQGDIIAFNVDSCSTITKANISLKIVPR